MATRQEQLDENIKRYAQLQKEHPDIDFQPMVQLGAKSINLEFDIKENVGQDIWDKIKATLTTALDEHSKDPQVAVASARSLLDGHKDLQHRFDEQWKHIDSSTVAQVHKMTSKHAV